MIDLHSHTTASDGTDSPAALVGLAQAIGLEALAITDHDTFAGYDEALPIAAKSGLDLVCGVELSTKMPVPGRDEPKTVHLLGYFVQGPPPASFREWLDGLMESRMDRNRRLVERLQAIGLPITLQEVVEEGRSLAGRPHFARVLMRKGIVSSMTEAFDRFLGEDAPSYVERESVSITEAIERLAAAGGLSVLAHPIRLGMHNLAAEAQTIAWLAENGLRGIEAYHSDQSELDRLRYSMLAQRHQLLITGGSDYHGGNKPQIALGTGYASNLRISRELLDRLRAL